MYIFYAKQQKHVAISQVRERSRVSIEDDKIDTVYPVNASDDDLACQQDSSPRSISTSLNRCNWTSDNRKSVSENSSRAFELHCAVMSW